MFTTIKLDGAFNQFSRALMLESLLPVMKFFSLFIATDSFPKFTGHKKQIVAGGHGLSLFVAASEAQMTAL